MTNQIPTTIDKNLYQTYPEIRLGFIRFKTIVKEPSKEFWDYMNQEVLPEVRKNMENKSWAEIEGVRGSRNAYKAFGRDPGRYRVSSEALLRRVRRNDELYHINSVVDVNNLISVTSGLSVGSYDLNKIKGDITLRKANAGEGYDGIGKKFLDMENMLMLVDDEGLFGSSTSDSTRTMVTDKTTDVLVAIYCFENNIDLEKLLESSKEAFIKYADAKDITSWII
ncbi:hypothetical protein IKD67_03870 [Candidatus Saccharibacteria bacterium]|nr:hypothetical protein [Candidatus Saccharibacteria bacterium]